MFHPKILNYQRSYTHIKNWKQLFVQHDGIDSLIENSIEIWAQIISQNLLTSACFVAFFSRNARFDENFAQDIDGKELLITGWLARRSLFTSIKRRCVKINKK